MYLDASLSTAEELAWFLFNYSPSGIFKRLISKVMDLLLSTKVKIKREIDRCVQNTFKVEEAANLFTSINVKMTSVDFTLPKPLEDTGHHSIMSHKNKYISDQAIM